MTSAEDLIITFHGCNAGMPERNKLRMKEMTYDFAIHTLYYENQDIRVPNFSLAIDTLELVFEIQTGKLLCIQGFFPLVQASEGNVNLPECKKGDYLLHNFDLSTCKQDEVYDLIKKIPQTQKYFEKAPIKYDKERGIIQIGKETGENEIVIEVSDNIICGLDQNSDLESIYIFPTRFINETTR